MTHVTRHTRHTQVTLNGDVDIGCLGPARWQRPIMHVEHITTFVIDPRSGGDKSNVIWALYSPRGLGRISFQTSFTQFDCRNDQNVKSLHIIYLQILDQ